MKNIHLIKSNSFNLTNNLINELTKDYVDIEKYDLDETEISNIITDSSYYGLFNNKKAIIINNVKYFGGKFLYEDETSLLLDYLNNLDDSYLIIFICNEISSSKKITKDILELGAVIDDLTDMSDKDIQDFINNYLKEKGVTADKESINRLLYKVNDNLDLFITEINKISIIKNKITIDDIDLYSNYNREEEGFEFNNALLAKDYKKAFEELDKLIDNKIDIIPLVGLLAKSYLILYIVKECMDNNISDEDICKYSGITSGRLFYNKKNAKIYTKDEIMNLIIDLSNVDKKIKTGSDPVYTLKEFLLNI